MSPILIQFTNALPEFPHLADVVPCPLAEEDKAFPSWEEVFCPASVRQRIGWLAKGKASGNSGIMGEVLQAAGEVLVDVIVNLFRTYSR